MSLGLFSPYSVIHFLNLSSVDSQTAVSQKKVIKLWLQLWDQTLHTW